MYPNTNPIFSRARSLRAALSDYGLPVRDESAELVARQRDWELRVLLPGATGGNTVRCFVSVPESRLPSGALELFNMLALEGYPAVALGAGRGEVSFEFSWFHPAGADWRISAQRCQGLLERVVSSLPPARRRRTRAARRIEADDIEARGVIARLMPTRAVA